MVQHIAPEPVFAALGDPRRARVVALLAERDRTASELAGSLGISLPGTLKHVAVLESAGIVTRSKRGRTVTVALEPGRLRDAEAWLHRTRTFWADHLAALAHSFEETP